ncbi:uncharacterized protein [Diadema setosum]|uniref:uncharacterized protein n=1 Tax=Diadema setosum TaxID=31175 RepID=UPI003B3BCC2B
MVSPSPPGCTDVTCIGMNELGSTSTVNEFCPTDPPGEDIITLQIEEQIVASEVNLVITCHIEPRDQPTPPINSYEISVDGETISSSSVPSAIVESRPNKYDIIDVQFNERVGENNGKIYTVVCHIDEEYQPTPGIHTFLITADNVTLSSSRSPSTAFTPRANGGTEVSCTGWNDFGSTTATKTFCPSAAVTFTVPSSLTANRQVTARCTESGVLESQTARWFLDGVQITEGVVTNSNQARQDKGWGYQGNVQSSVLADGNLPDLDHSKCSTASVSVPPPNDAIQVEFQESGDLREVGGQVDLTISCEIASHTRPFPPIDTYVIKKGSQTVSTSNSVTLSPRPDRCTNFTCIGENDSGSASSVETYCPKNPPRDHIIDIEFDEGLDDRGQGIVTISCHVTDIDQPYPALEMYEIKVGSVTVSNSSSSSFTVSPIPPGCTSVTCIGMNELGSTSTVNEFCPTDPPREDIITLQIEEQIVASEVNLVITCHIELHDRPTPPIDSYEISVDGETISSSSVPSAIVESRPNKCVNIMCEGRNKRGSTRSMDLYCFRDDIIDVQFNEGVGENNVKIYTVICHIDEEYQPTPGIHTFLITADNVTLLSSRSPSTAFTPRADGGTEVSCTGWNDFGSTTATKTFYPSAVEIIAGFQRQGALQRSSTTYALLVVVFFLSVIVCVAYVNRRRAFFPPDEVQSFDQ